MPKRSLALCIAVIAALVMVIETADARKRRYHGAYDSDFMVVTPDGSPFEPRRHSRGGRKPAPIPLGAVVPPGWQLQSPEPNWQGKRFMSPDGAAWLAIYKTPANAATTEHMKSIAFADGETLTYIQGERSWIAAAGFKGSHMFYRKAILACGGRVWHHVAFEYPPEVKTRIERFIVLAAEGLHDSQTDCDEAVAERQQ